MIEDQWRDPVELSVGDIENYRQTDQIVLAMNRLKLHAGKPVEYCKSALYPFSYLDRYKVKELLEAAQGRSSRLRRVFVRPRTPG